MGGIPCSDECIPLSGQRPFTISSQNMTYTDFSFMSYLSPTFVTFPHSSRMAARTPSYVQIYGWSSDT